MKAAVEMRVRVTIGEVEVVDQSVTIPVPPASAGLSDDAVANLVRQGALKLLPSIAVRSPADLRKALEVAAQE